MYAPKAYQSYHAKIEALSQRYPALIRNFPRSIFSAASFNFLPNAFSLPHVDHGNRAAGFCPIFSVGNFNYRRGGHLVLDDQHLVIEFPAGCKIAIPSASCKHGNIPDQTHETCASFTQYAAGGLSRYVEHGFKTWKQLKASDPVHTARMEKGWDTRWLRELDIFSKVNEHHEDRVRVGIVTV